MEKKAKKTIRNKSEDKPKKRSKRKSRKKKELDISIDTKKVDVDIERDAEGNVDIEIDAQKFDAKYTKTEDKVSLEVELEDGKSYLFEGNGKNRRLPKGAFWKLSGTIVKMFLKRGWGKLKKDK
jgi:hypothetical protein